MKIRRVATGHTADGRSVVASDDQVEAITVDLLPGFAFHRIWGADPPVHVPGGGSPTTDSPYFPSAGGFRFGLFTVPPDAALRVEDVDVMAALAEMEQALPGMAEHMEIDHPGMHTTDTVDFEYVVSGRIVLELDDGETAEVGPGDTVVQNGTRHAWRNPFDEPCVMVVVLVGAERDAPG
jgi:mannose-6-phosphate isomerase-like protein (cupin superfamily)